MRHSAKFIPSFWSLRSKVLNRNVNVNRKIYALRWLLANTTARIAVQMPVSVVAPAAYRLGRVHKVAWEAQVAIAIYVCIYLYV
jgi:hypothetical protein